MIKLIIFDLDGVLIDSKKIHFNSLNIALEYAGYPPISYTEHLKKLDGLPTLKKLNLLSKKDSFYKFKILNSDHDKIIKIKNKYTAKFLKSEIKYNDKIYNLFKKLSYNYKIAVATNAIKNTLKTSLKKLRINSFIDYSLSAEQVKKPKPHPEIYLKCIINFNVKPSEVLILEDSYYGRSAAIDSGANLFPVTTISDVNYSKITNFIKKIESSNIPKNKFWHDDKLNILVPMAGAGTRFSEAGYTFPKPLIEIHKKTMIQLVLDSLNIKANYIFIVQSKHQKKYNINSLLKTLYPTSIILETNGVTKGAACTTLLAKKFIDNSNRLIIANSDQFIEWNPGKTMYDIYAKNVDGAILVFKSLHPKWSYAKVDANDYVVEVAEKKVISDLATVGVYYWRRGSDYIKYAKNMIKKNIKTNGEFYVCPVFNEAILEKKRIKVAHVDNMWGLGTPEDLNYFKENYNFYKKNKIF